MPNNRLGMTFGIDADPSKAEAGIDAFGARLESLRSKYQEISSDMSRLQGLPFISGEEAEGLAVDQELLSQIRSEAQGLGATFQEAEAGSQSLGQSLRSNLGDMMAIRRAMYATFGLVSFGYMIDEWGRLKDAVANTASSLGGYDAGLRQIMADTAKMNEKLLTSFGDLTTAQLQELSLITDQHARSQKRIKDEIANTQTQLDTLSKSYSSLQHTADVIHQYRQARKEAMEEGETGGIQTQAQQQQMTLLNQALKEHIDLSGDLDAIEKEAKKRSGQIQDGTKKLLEMRLQLMDADQKSEKSADAAARHAETAAHREAAAARQAARALQEQQAFMDRIAEGFHREAAENTRQLQQWMRTADEAARQQQEFLLRGQIEEGRSVDRNTKNVGAEAAARGMMHWRALVEQSHEAQAKMKADNKELADSYRRMADQVRSSFDAINQSVEMLGSSHTRVFGEIGAMMERSISLEHQNAKESGAAALSKTQFAIGALKQLAPVEAAVQTAKALGDLGDFNFWGAGQHFASAAMWGTVSASQVMGMIGAAGGGSRAGSKYSGGRGRAEGAGGSGEEWRYGAESTVAQTLAPGAQHPSGGGNLTVAIMGDEQSGQWLATTLNRAVTQQGVNLVSTSSQRGAPVGH